MKSVRLLPLIAALLLIPSAAHASPADAVTVIQTCGTPLTDSTTSGPEAPPERILHYRRADLHFQQDHGGWNFLFATVDNASRMIDRAQTSQLLPCFQQAMDSVRVNTAAYPAAPNPASTRSFNQWLMQPVYGLRRIGYLPLLLLYLLPSIIGYFRRAPRLRTVVLVDLFLGWTVLGWAYALLLSNEDPVDTEDTVAPEYGDANYATDSASGILHLNLIDISEPAAAEPYLQPRTRPSPPQLPAASAAASEPAPTPAVAPAPSAAEPGGGILSFGVTFAPRSIDPNPKIHWTEQFSPARRCRLEVLSASRQVTLYEMDLTQRGFDDDGREYLGGYSNRLFFSFPVEHILHLRDLAA